MVALLGISEYLGLDSPAKSCVLLFFLVLNGLGMQYVQDIQAVFDPGNIVFFLGDDQSAGWCWPAIFPLKR